MKHKLISLLSFLLFSVTIFGQNEEIISQYFPYPKVDRRVELLSIVFRVVGIPEYNDRVYSSYVNDIHEHFDKFKEHEIFSYIRKLRKEHNIGYDAVMSMAIHIEQPPLLAPIFEFSSSIDQRWNSETAFEFLELLQRFYKESDCESFFQEHENLYKVAEKRFENIYNNINISWYEDFYGVKPKGDKYLTIISIGNGGFNYGARITFPNGNTEKYSIIGTSKIDSINLPIYDIESLLPTYIHEFQHSFINPLTKKHEVEFENSCKKLYEIVEWCMKRQAYATWQTMLNESLVRASVIRYLIKYSTTEQAEMQLKEDFGRNFFWIKELVDIIGIYESNRTEYPTFESYMPVIQEFFHNIAIETEKSLKLKI